MTIEEQLKQEILSRYQSVRAFTTSIGIPYSTLDSVFKRGISNAGVSTVIKIFNALDLDVESITGEILRAKCKKEKSPSSADETALEEEKEELLDLMNDFLVSSGFIRKGQDLTDRQADAIVGVCKILRAIFED